MALIDAEGLALALGRMDDDGLRQAEQRFRLAASEGWQTRVLGGEFMEFGEGARMIWAAVVRIIAAHREEGVPLLGALQRLAADVDGALTRTDEIDRLEDLWQLEL